MSIGIIVQQFGVSCHKYVSDNNLFRFNLRCAPLQEQEELSRKLIDKQTNFRIYVYGY